MRDLWDTLPVLAQDVIVCLALLLPVLVVGAVILRGYAPWPLVRAILWRFRWPTAIYVAFIAVAIGIGIGLVAQERALRAGTAAAADKFDLVIAAPGSEVTMLLASVFLQPSDVTLLDGETFNEIAALPDVDLAAPLAFGDSVDGAPVVGTTAAFVDHLSDGRIEGRLWRAHHEAVIGAAVPHALGEHLEPAHGVGEAAEEDAHGGAELEIVGRLAPTGTPWDRAVLVPIEGVWETHGLAAGHAPERAEQIGPPFDARYFPGTPAVVVHADSLAANYGLRAQYDTGEGTMAFFPGTVLSQLYGVMGDVRQAMSLMSLVTQGLVAASVLLGLFILSHLMRRQMALLRALGAPARFLFVVVWSHAAFLLAAGAALGIGVGYAAASVLSAIVTARTGVTVTASLGWTELHLVAGFVSLACLAALLPAAAVLRQPVVEALRG